MVQCKLELGEAMVDYKSIPLELSIEWVQLIKRLCVYSRRVHSVVPINSKSDSQHRHKLIVPSN